MSFAGFLYAWNGSSWCEILNDNRSYALQVNNPSYTGCDDCAEECRVLDHDPSDVLCQPPVYAPVTWPSQPSGPLNPAPWYDPDRPDSNGFWGFLVRRIIGHDDARHFERTVHGRVTDGSNVSRARWGGRSITFELIATGEDTCAVDYGMQWLIATLTTLASRCGSFDILMRSCCPTLTGTPGSPEWLRAYETGLMTFKNVRLIVAPQWGEDIDFDGCTFRYITFTLHASDPCVYTKCVPCFAEPFILPKPVGSPSLCSMYAAGVPNAACAWFEDAPEDPLACCEVDSGAAFEGITSTFTITNSNPSDDWGPVAIYIGVGAAGLDCDNPAAPIQWSKPLVITKIPASSTVIVKGKEQQITAIYPGQGEQPAFDLLKVSAESNECWPAVSAAGCDAVYLGIGWGSFSAAWCAENGSYDDDISVSVQAERFYGCGEGCS